MKKIWLLSFLCIFIFSQNITATPVDVIKKKAPTETSIQKKKKKKRFFARMTERIMKKRVGKMIKKLRINSSDCDKIIMNDGEELEVKIIKMGEERIRYKNCDFQNGPTRTLRKEDVFMIKYADGRKEVITDIETLKVNQKEAIQTAELNEKQGREFWTIGFLVGLLLGIFSLLIFALALNGEKRKRALRGSLVGILTRFLIVLFLLSLLLPFF